MLQHKLEEIKIIVFKGEATDQTKEPFFRAEWSINDDPKHAQPHWHVYNFDASSLVKERVEEPFRPEHASPEVRDFGGFANTTETISQRETMLKFDKFHFAMASNWHMNSEHHVTFDNENSLINWLARCLHYIQIQLQYLDSRERRQ